MSASDLKHAGLTLATLVTVLVLASLLDAAPARKTVYATHFSAGPGRAVAERSCMACHGATLVTQQHKDSTGWEKSVKQMETWGVRLSPAERDTLVAYLRTRFGPERRK